MKKFIASVALILFLSTTALAGTGSIIALGAMATVVSGALIGTLLSFPVVAPYLAAAVIIGAAGSTVIHSSQPSSTPGYAPKVDASGNISKPSDVVYVDLVNHVPTVEDQKTNAVISYSQLQSIVSANPNSYPLTNAALHQLPAPAVGLVVPASDGSHVLLAAPYFASCVSPNYYGVKNYPSNNYISFSGGPGNASGCDPQSPSTSYKFTIVSSPLSTGATTPAQFKNVVASSGVVSPTYQSEIDAMLHDPNYVPSFNDDTGLPYAPPPGALSAAQINTALAAKTASDAAATAAANAASSASVAAAANSTAAAAIAAAAAAGGTNADLNAAAAAANTAAGIANAASGAADTAAANAAAANAHAAAAAGDDATTQAANSAITAPATGAAYGDGKEPDFKGRISDFLADMKTSPLFSLPGQFFGNIPNGGTSVFHLDFGRMGKTDFDLASYGSAISLIKTLVLAVFSIAGFRIITLKGGGG